MRMPDVLYQRMEQLDRNNEYIAWLKAQLGTDDNNTLQKTTGRVGTTDLTQLSPNPGRAFGYRTVSLQGLQKKMRDIFIAGQWRPMGCSQIVLGGLEQGTSSEKAEDDEWWSCRSCSSRGRAKHLRGLPPQRLRIARVVRLSSHLWHAPSKLFEDSRNKYQVRVGGDFPFARRLGRAGIGISCKFGARRGETQLA